MVVLVKPLSLLKKIRKTIPGADYLAQDRDGRCWIYDQKPSTYLNCWGLIDGDNHINCFKVSLELTKSLIWTSEDWKERIITTN